jgi:hypothetical protein
VRTTTLPVGTVMDPDSDWIRIQLAQRIRIRIRDLDTNPGWPKLAPKKEKMKKVHV